MTKIKYGADPKEHGPYLWPEGLEHEIGGQRRYPLREEGPASPEVEERLARRRANVLAGFRRSRQIPETIEQYRARIMMERMK